MTYKQAYKIYDVIRAETYEGSKTYDFSQKVWSVARQTQKYALSLPYLDENRKLQYSKHLSFPRQHMEARLNSILAKKRDERSELRYYLDSAHDDNIANMLVWLNAYQYQYPDIPYASSIIFELHYDQNCLDDNKYDPSIAKSKCFTVEIYHDGKPLTFDTCLVNNKARNDASETCYYDDFIQYMDKISVTGQDLDYLCYDVKYES